MTEPRTPPMKFKRARAAAEKRMTMMRRDVIIGVLVVTVEMGSVVVVVLWCWRLVLTCVIL